MSKIESIATKDPPAGLSAEFVNVHHLRTIIIATILLKLAF